MISVQSNSISPQIYQLFTTSDIMDTISMAKKANLFQTFLTNCTLWEDGGTSAFSNWQSFSILGNSEALRYPLGGDSDVTHLVVDHLNAYYGMPLVDCQHTMYQAWYQGVRLTAGAVILVACLQTPQSALWLSASLFSCVVLRICTASCAGWPKCFLLTARKSCEEADKAKLRDKW